MRKAYVSVNGIKAGILEELQSGKYQFSYIDDYHESARAFRVRSCLLPLYSRITKVINHNGSKGQDLTLVPIPIRS
ncbi:TPA: hypothetical protein ACF9NF_003302 [Legionella pneumophila]